jgi:hypothetical protein
VLVRKTVVILCDLANLTQAETWELLRIDHHFDGWRHFGFAVGLRPVIVVAVSCHDRAWVGNIMLQGAGRPAAVVSLTRTAAKTCDEMEIPQS